jgi:hypothetical protein
MKISWKLISTWDWRIFLSMRNVRKSTFVNNQDFSNFNFLSNIFLLLEILKLNIRFEINFQNVVKSFCLKLLVIGQEDDQQILCKSWRQTILSLKEFFSHFFALFFYIIRRIRKSVMRNLSKKFVPFPPPHSSSCLLIFDILRKTLKESSKVRTNERSVIMTMQENRLSVWLQSGLMLLREFW